jgi:serine/threonine protein kinase
MSRGAYGIWQNGDNGRGAKTVPIFNKVENRLIIESATLREIAFYRSVKHTNIAECYKIQLSGSRVSLELESGDRDLNDYILKTNYPNRVKSFYKIFIGILHALEFLHNNGIAHGDLKPKNIILKNNTAKLIDFGGSQLRYLNNYKRGMTTFVFISPEDSMHDIYGQTNDIWSLGMVILYYFERKYRNTSWEDKNCAKAWFEKNTEIDIKNVLMPKFIRSLLSKILVWDHEKRPTAKQLIEILDPNNIYKSQGNILLKKIADYHINPKNEYDLLQQYYFEIVKPDNELIKYICELLAPIVIDPWYDNIYIDDICYKVYKYTCRKLRDHVRTTIIWVLEVLSFDLWILT